MSSLFFAATVRRIFSILKSCKAAKRICAFFMHDLKQLARRIFSETLASIDISLVMERALQRSGTLLQCDDFVFDLRHLDDVLVIAVGKAAHAMLNALARILSPDTRFRGIASAPTASPAPLPGVSYFVGGHPLPNEASCQAARAILSELNRCSEKTLVIFLLSGGGSSLMELPLDPSQTLEQIQALYRALVSCGASIDEINAVRKHLSAVKGGRLALAAERATKLTLAITDVPVGKESALASGPTLPDPTTCADVSGILQNYSLRPLLPPEVRQWIDSGRILETPKPGHLAFKNAHFFLLLSMHELFHAAHRAAEAEGFVACCDNSTDDWPVGRAAESLLAQLENLQRAYSGQPVALIADGELSSPVTANGIGGRNSAFVLSCVERITGKRVAVLSAGTDGVDGNSPAAGAVADGETLSRARSADLRPDDYFHRNDAYSFFKRLGDTLETGPTGNNLRDLRIFLAEPR
jgi:glycerate 2-kinase